jgi:hypothetical protein
VALLCVRSVALLMPSTHPDDMPCRDNDIEREQWGLRRPPGGSPLSCARTHGMTDTSETKQRRGLSPVVPLNRFVRYTCAPLHVIFCTQF